MKQLTVKTDVAGVFPLLGTSEETKSRKIRVSKNQPYTLALVGFRVTPVQAIDAATALLSQAKAAQNGGKNTVIDVLARRKEGASVLLLQTAIAPPERKKRPKSVGANGNSHSAPKKRKQPKTTATAHKETPAAASSEAAA